MIQAEWWKHFGDCALELQRIAVKVLSQTTSSSNCERNWSTFSLIHTKIRNRLKYKKLHALVFVHYNMRLKIRNISRKSQQELEESFNPINLDYIFTEDDPLTFWLEEREQPLLDGVENDWLNLDDEDPNIVEDLHGEDDEPEQQLKDSNDSGETGNGNDGDDDDDDDDDGASGGDGVDASHRAYGLTSSQPYGNYGSTHGLSSIGEDQSPERIVDLQDVYQRGRASQSRGRERLLPRDCSLDSTSSIHNYGLMQDLGSYSTENSSTDHDFSRYHQHPSYTNDHFDFLRYQGMQADNWGSLFDSSYGYQGTNNSSSFDVGRESQNQNTNTGDDNYGNSDYVPARNSFWW